MTQNTIINSQNLEKLKKQINDISNFLDSSHNSDRIHEILPQVTVICNLAKTMSNQDAVLISKDIESLRNKIQTIIKSLERQKADIETDINKSTRVQRANKAYLKTQS